MHELHISDEIHVSDEIQQTVVLQRILDPGTLSSWVRSPGQTYPGPGPARDHGYSIINLPSPPGTTHRGRRSGGGSSLNPGSGGRGPDGPAWPARWVTLILGNACNFVHIQMENG